MCHVQPPSHLPVVGGALKLHGHPQSQLHAIRTVPLRRQCSAADSLRGYIYDFIHLFAPALDRATVDAALAGAENRNP